MEKIETKNGTLVIIQEERGVFWRGSRRDTAAVSLLWIPFGTVIGILVIIYLIKPEIREYFESAQKIAIVQ